MAATKHDLHREPTLFPVIADTSVEQRTVSIFVSVFRLIPPFHESILRQLGVPTGTRTKVNCTVEPQLTGPTAKGESESLQHRPDAMIEVDTGRSAWTALVEAKIEDKTLEGEQVGAYIQLAKERGYQAVITISNDFVENPTISPVKNLGKLPKNVNLFHLSWSSILTDGLIVRDSEQLKDPVQKQVMEDFVKYLRHPRSGLRQFNRMNSEWKEVVQQSRAPERLSRMKNSDPRLLATVKSWHQEVRDITLQLSSDSGCPINQKLRREHSNYPDKRVQHDVKALIENATLKATFHSPESAFEFDLRVVLSSGQISCSVSVPADEDRATLKGRTTQLQYALSDIESTHWNQIQICAWYKGAKYPEKHLMSEFMADPLLMHKEGTNKPPSSFEIIVAMDKPNRFDGRESFITILEEHVMRFYTAVWWKL